MKQIALSIEQMKHLESLGLDTSDASMEWQYISWEGYELKVCNDNCVAGELGIPAYTLQNIMRKITNWSNHLLISFVYFGEGVACILSTENDNVLHSCSSSVYKNETDIDASYQMLLWCIENNYIKTSKV